MEGEQSSNTAVVTLTVTAANDSPVAVSDRYTTTEDIPLIVPAEGVLENDTDIEDDPLSAVLDSSPSNGILALQSDGSFVYTPTLHFTGTDSFTYHANDGYLDSNTVLVTLVVTEDISEPEYYVYLPTTIK